MSDDWKLPLKESLHHLATTCLVLSMLIYDFAPVVLMLLLMEVSEWLVHDKNYSVLGVPLQTIMNHIEVSLLIAFMTLGAIKVLLRLCVSIWEMNRPRHTA